MDNSFVNNFPKRSGFQSSIQEFLTNLVGESTQTPPIYSAIKVKGKRLYKYARQEQEVELPIRDVAVNNFKLISYDGNKAKFIATVSKGTYIRSLIVDLAESIGTKAVVSSINRIEIGNLSIKNSNVIKNIEQLERTKTPEPLDWRILFDIPTISVEDSVLKDIKNGNFLKSSLFGTDVPHIIENKNSILDTIKQNNIENIDVISEENIKSDILSKSIFAVSKSGTISLQICNANIPSIIIYKLSFINFMIFKMLVNVKFANIINIINNREIIPELLQNECNAQEIYKTVIYFLKNPDLIKKQLAECNKTLVGIRSRTSSSDESSTVLSNYLVS